MMQKKKELKLTRLGNSNISYDEDGNIWWEEEDAKVKRDLISDIVLDLRDNY